MSDTDNNSYFSFPFYSEIIWVEFQGPAKTTEAQFESLVFDIINDYLQSHRNKGCIDLGRLQTHIFKELKANNYSGFHPHENLCRDRV